MVMENKMINVSLLNGVKMPILGYGTYKITNDVNVKKCVLDALKVGYRRIDTATLYGNEAEIGKAIKESGIARKDLFITSKLWTNILTAEDTNKAVDEMLNNLQTDYLDLLLIHWPTKSNNVVWRAMENLYADNRLKSIGVSNFKQYHIEEIINEENICPMVNQVELHPLFQQPELCRYCDSKGIIVEAWSPLMRGNALDLPVLNEIAQKHKKSPSQIILRFDIQSGIAVIPKTINKNRMIENFSVFDFELSETEMKLIKELDKNDRQYRDPDNHGF